MELIKIKKKWNFSDVHCSEYLGEMADNFWPFLWTTNTKGSSLASPMGFRNLHYHIQALPSICKRPVGECYLKDYSCV